MATPVKNTRPKERGGRFRVLVGDHVEQGPPGCECPSCVRSGGKDHRYAARRYNGKGEPLDPEGYDNDIIDSKLDLTRFNRGPNAKKFERIHEERQRRHSTTDHAQAEATDPPAEEATISTDTSPARQIPENLEQWSRSQLERYGQKNGIDLSSARSREEMIQVIRSGS